MIVVVKTRKQMKHDPPPVTHNADGSLTRVGAAIEARKLWGDLGSISSDEQLPRLVWSIGRFDQTIGRGRTWEIALARSTQRKAKLDAKAKAELARAQKEVSDVAAQS